MAGLDPATQSHRTSASAARLTIAENESPARADARALGGRVKPGQDELGNAEASIGDIPPAKRPLYICSMSKGHSQHHDTHRKRDITCDGSVTAETAEFCGCDGVMDRIASVLCGARMARSA
jgi:hypothetical protein